MTTGSMKGRTFVIYRAERAVTYRYICEKCEKTTEWQENVLWEEAASRKRSRPRRFIVVVERTIKELEKTAENAVAELGKVTKAMEKIIDIEGERYLQGGFLLAKKYNAIFDAGKKCPYCNAKQSWYPVFCFKPQKWKFSKKCTKVAFFISIIVLTIVTISMVQARVIPFADVIYLLPIPFAMAAISGWIAFFYAVWISRKYKYQRKSSLAKQKPEVKWGEISVGLVGYPDDDHPEGVSQEEIDQLLS